MSEVNRLGVSLAKALAGVLFVVGLLGCAPKATVVLLPEADGRVGKLAVKAGGGAPLVLDQAYQTAEARIDGVDTGTTTAEAVMARYASVRTALPKAPQRFQLYFEAGGEQLTEASRATLDDVRQSLAGYAAPEIVVIGHTDRVGAAELNDALSLKRAEVVRELLVAEGFERQQMSVVGRGEREPAVPTEDEVDEPRNRRVEVKVR